MEQGNAGGTEFLTCNQVATDYNVTVGNVKTWWRKGRLPGYRLGHRTVRFARSDVEAFFASRRVESS